VHGSSNRLVLGPIVGHTDDASTRIWIQVRDDPTNYSLRIRGRGIFPFFSTEENTIDFGTAVAVADRLRAEHKYGYQVLRKGYVVPGAGGSVRTMPSPGSMADVMFVSLSCSSRSEEGAWPLLGDFIKQYQPRFLVMTGDQVYLDGTGDPESIWPPSKHRTSKERKKAIARRYWEHWRRDPIRHILANTPCYMLWDDHDIRDGWGSWASDSPTLQQRYPGGAKIAQAYNEYFEDARKAYWHFQMCRNLAVSVEKPVVPEPFLPNQRLAMPFVFQCGRLMVFMLDGRGDRDLWRENGDPVLGHEQWRAFEEAIDSLVPDVDAVAFVTGAPIVAMSPKSDAQKRFGRRTDDIELFKAGKAEELLKLQIGHERGSDKARVLADAITGGLVDGLFGPSQALIDQFDDLRDYWAHYLSLPEAERLIRLAAKARTQNRTTPRAREVLFLGGDVHSGALLQISVDCPQCVIPCLVSSGIAKIALAAAGVTFDERFEVAEGIRVELKELVGDFNFGVTHALFSGGTPIVRNFIVYPGTSNAYSLQIRPSAVLAATAKLV
jgi:hypothetical protein